MKERGRAVDDLNVRCVGLDDLPPLPSMSISEVALMQTFLLPGGARYEQRAAFPRV